MGRCSGFRGGLLSLLMLPIGSWAVAAGEPDAEAIARPAITNSS